MTPPASRTLIMGVLAGLSLAESKPFFLSLEKAGYAGDICLFVGDLDAETQIFLLARRVNLIPFRKAYLKPRWARLGGLAKPFLSATQTQRLDEQLGLSYLHLFCARYIYYLNYLDECGAGYDRVFVTDIRDVLFQTDPFACDLPEGLSVFLEDASLTLGQCPTNSAWLRQAYGPASLRELGGKRIICAGTIYGQPAALREFFGRMVERFYARQTRLGIDQAVFNYILHQQPPPQVRQFENADGPVLTMAQVKPEKFAFNADGRLVNAANRVYNVLHQYDRHPELKSRLLKLLT